MGSRTQAPDLRPGAVVEPDSLSPSARTRIRCNRRTSALLPVLLLAAAALSLFAQTRPSTQPLPAAIPAPSAVWKSVGPPQVSTSAWNLVSGRVLSIAADPSDSTGNTVDLGTEGGGVWKSTNAAASPSSVTFTPLTDNLSVWSSSFLTSLSVGAVSVQPGGTGVILAGTGDPNSGSDSWYGAGFLRSTDGGNTWNMTWITAVSQYGVSYDLLGTAIAGYAWSTTTPNLVVAAVSEPGNITTIVNSLSKLNTLGVYYSQDAGTTWHLATLEDGTQVLQGEQYLSMLGNAATAVVWNPIRQRFYAAIRFHGYYESLDGITWTRLANQTGANLTLARCPTNAGAEGSPACPLFRGALAVQPSTGDMYALSVDTVNLDQGLWQDACHLKSGSCSSSTVQFATKIDDNPLQSPAGSGTLAQADSSFWLTAVPSQQDTLLFAGTQDIWRCSLANSCVWRNTTNTQSCAAAQLAPSQRAVDTTFGSTGLLYFGNDGGLWRSIDAVNQQKTVCSTDDASHFQNLNSGLGSLAQIAGFAQDPATPSTWLAALGPLGTAAPSADLTTPWPQVLNGEGDAVAIDPESPFNWYATSIGGVGINRCTEGAACNLAGFGTVAIGEAQVQNDFQTIPAPWILDPQNPANIILGTCRVWRGPATGSGWSQQNLLSSMLDNVDQPNCDGNAQISAIAAAPISSGSLAGNGAEQLYVGMAASLDGGALIAGHVLTAAVNNDSQASGTTWIDRFASPVTNQGSAPTTAFRQFPRRGFRRTATPRFSAGSAASCSALGSTRSRARAPIRAGCLSCAGACGPRALCCTGSQAPVSGSGASPSLCLGCWNWWRFCSFSMPQVSTSCRKAPAPCEPNRGSSPGCRQFWSATLRCSSPSPSTLRSACISPFRDSLRQSLMISTRNIWSCSAGDFSRRWSGDFPRAGCPSFSASSRCEAVCCKSRSHSMSSALFSACLTKPFSWRRFWR